ncbi:hypothetical protein [Streptomyces sp. NPDC005955]|uniref:hypothetical protein n=1 Tax=Streptomyces sp. NPDC005955 TaxID=3364738 RepID=UPI0036CE7DAA
MTVGRRGVELLARVGPDPHPAVPAPALLIGIGHLPPGIAAAIGVVFFVGAVVSHLRVEDGKGAPVP